MKSVEHVLRRADLSVKPMSEGQLNAILIALMSLSDDGVLITDLEHHPIACNGVFGDIFRVDPATVTEMEIEELRGYVYPRLKDPTSWVQKLDQIYAEPMLVHEDELELDNKPRSTFVRRRTGPLLDTNGNVIGRLWSFKDVTSSHERERRRASLIRVSEFYDVDPIEVCHFVLQELSDYYDSMALLSIWSGEKMIFRDVIRPPAGAEHIRENFVKDSYCQLALSAVRPVFIQNAHSDTRIGHIPPMDYGLVRYLGAPLVDQNGQPIGTICFIDDKSDHPLGPGDLEFISVLAQRVSTELERERLHEIRIAEHREVVERQRKDLSTTEQVLQSMNSAFNLLGTSMSFDDLMRNQARLLAGLVGYSSVALITTASEGYNAVVALKRTRGCKEVSISSAEFAPILNTLSHRRNAFETVSVKRTSLGTILGTDHATVARLPMDGPASFIVWGAKHPITWTEHHATHMTALTDQVALLLTASRLQNELSSTLDELQATQSLLIQSEKLSIVGTLAASIAHDIRNIVASLLLECTLPIEDHSEFQLRVKHQVERFSVLSNRLLVYARPQQLSRSEGDINEIVCRAADVLAGQARMWKCEVVLDLDPTMCPISLDETCVEHAFVNIMLNALQAMNTDGGQLAITSKREVDHISIKFSDNGRGISPEKIESIFEPFVSTRSDGFGLGLYSCRQSMHDHGWTISVESNERVGSTFLIRIPLENTQ